LARLGFPQRIGYNPSGLVGAFAFWAVADMVDQTLDQTQEYWLHGADMSGPGRFLRKPWTIAALGFVAAGATVLAIALHVPDPDISPALAQRRPDVVHGEYIAVLGDCAGCHTANGGRALAGGVAFATPIGTIYSTNITPDRDSGIGKYGFKDFVRAMRMAAAPDGTRLYPAMPYTAYAKMSDEDLQDLFAYLQSGVAPINQAPRANAIPWPLGIRWPLAFWNIAFHSDSRFVADPAKDVRWNRGAYLVEALEHCGECHTPRRVTQSLNNSRKFAGTVTQGWMAYNITADPQSGIGGWDGAALTAYLTTGQADGHSSASGPMAEVIVNSLRHLAADDIRAIVAYLRSIAPIETVPAIAQNPPALSAAEPSGGLGEQVFAGNCANCHDWDGKGVQSPYAALLGSRTVNDPAATNLMAILLAGSNTPLPAEHVFMPPFWRGHSDDELAAVANFCNGYFGNGTAKVSAADIGTARKALPQTSAPEPMSRPAPP
jgi:mono/diheme cytochrome c family protein